MKQLAKSTVTLLAALMFARPMATPSATAADLPDADRFQDPIESGWAYEIAPYFWAPGLTGDVGVFGAPPVGA